MRRRAAWEIAEDEPDRDFFSVWRGNRVQLTGVSRGTAEGLVRKHRQPGERVWLVEVDGYRTELTKAFDAALPRGPR